jgi:DNA-binding NtrC family response regulator
VTYLQQAREVLWLDLERHQFNLDVTAERLGMSRDALWSRMCRLNMVRRYLAKVELQAVTR